MGHKDRVAYAASISAEDAAAYLESLAAGLRQHALLVESGEASVVLDFGRDVDIELEFNADRKKSSIEFALTSHAAQAEAAGQRALHVLTRDMVDRRNGDATGGVNGARPRSTRSTKKNSAGPSKGARVKPVSSAPDDARPRKPRAADNGALAG